MLTLLQRARPVSAPSPTLRFLAGDHADSVAGLWPAPHGPYLEMRAARRHLAHIVLAVASDEPPARLAANLAHERADAIVARYLGAAPAGFVKMLGKLGEVAWAGVDYVRLVRLFADPGAALLLRQTPLLSPGLVEAVEGLAPPLRRPPIARWIVDPRHAALLSEAFAAAAAIRTGEEELLLERWSRAKDAQRLFAMAAEDLQPRAFVLAPFPEHPDLLRITTLGELTSTARRFRNCLASYAERASLGQIAILTWAGPPPGAVCLVRDPIFGWRLEEAKGVGNETLAAEAQVRLIQALRQAGVRVGRAGGELRNRLLEAAGEDHGWGGPEDPVALAFL